MLCADSCVIKDETNKIFKCREEIVIFFKSFRFILHITAFYIEISVVSAPQETTTGLEGISTENSRQETQQLLILKYNLQ